ncbi:MAG: LysR family transcriptional regulator [Pseudomonadota bacterium]
MIDKLRAIAIFATVVDHGTFRAAAKHLGLAPSRVSETVSGLEHALGVTLLYRSTRQLSLTHEGRVLHERAVQMLDTIENGLDAISPAAADPRGALRVTAPAFVTQTALMDSFAGFAHAFPKVDLHFDFSDAPRDLIGDGYDVAIRAGWPKDSDLMTRVIGGAERLLVTSPDYMAGRPMPNQPQDLETWDWIRFTMRPAPTPLTHQSGKTATVLGRSSLSVNSADALYQYAVRGLGLSIVPENLALRGFERGELIHVLPEWSPKPLGLHAVWPDTSRRQTLTTLFIRHLAEA